MVTRPALHGYQHDAVSHLHRNPRAGLFLDMGLGKTCVCLSALTPEHLPALVIAPKRVVTTNVWGTEAKKWRPDLRLASALGEPKIRAQVLASDADVIVITRDTMEDTVAFRSKFKTVIVDESSGYKDRGSNRWKTARRLIRPIIGMQGAMANVWLLTGTPSPNGLMDLWSQIFLIDGGERLGKTLTGFRARYFYAGRQLPSGVVTEWVLREEAEAAIHKKLEDIVLSMTSEGRVDVEEPLYNEVEVPLPPAIRRHYKTMKADLLLDLEVLGGSIYSASSGGILTNKLSQIASGFLFHDAPLGEPPPGTYDILHREKLRALGEIIEGTGSPLLVAHQYRPEADLIKETFPDLVHTLDEPNAVERWTAGEIPVLLAHPASAGHGLNLQGGPGHTAVWYTLPWSLEEWDQFNKRLARQGQANRVVIHMLMAPKTVDLAKRDRVILKKSVQDALMQHLESPL